MRYLASRNLRIPRNHGPGKQSILTLVRGELAPADVSPLDAAPFVEADFLREVSDDEATRVMLGPRPPTLNEQASAAFFASYSS